MTAVISRCSLQGEIGAASFTAPVFQYDQLLKWATDKCIPLVREITFQNAEVTEWSG